MAKILVVDDHQTNRQVLTTLLGYGGHQSLEAADGTEALDLARRESPDLVITDILMPTMDGFEFVSRLRGEAEIARTPVIFYTATYLEKEAAALARACGVDHVIVKPAEPQQVLDAVSTALHLGKPSAASMPAAEPAMEPIRVIAAKLAKKVGELDTVGLRLAALLELGIELGSERDPLRLLERFAAGARKVIGARYAAVSLVAEDEKTILVIVPSGVDRDVASRIGHPPIGSGIFGEILRKRGPVRLRQVSDHPAAATLPPDHPPMGSFLGVPLSTQERLYGLLYLADKLGSDEFSEEDERIAQTISAQVAVAYENALRYEEIQRHAAQLQIEIAERSRAEEELRAAELRYRELVENIPAVTYIAALGEESGMLYLSPQIEHLVGYRPEEWLEDPQSWRRSLHPDDRDRVLADLRRSRADGEPLHTEYRMIAKDGSEVWVRDDAAFVRDEQGRALFVQGVLLNVTVRKKAEAALREREEHFRTLIENSSDLISVTDVRGNIAYLSPASMRILGYRPEELIGGNAFSFVHPDDLPTVRAELSAIVRAPGSMVPISARLQHKDGSWRDLEAIGRNMLHDPAVGGIVVNSRDVTERKLAEAEIHQRLGELEAINRISTALRAAEAVQDMLPVLLEETIAALRAETGGVWLLEPASDEVVLAAQSGWGEAPIPSRRKGEGIPGHVIATGEPYASMDLRNDPLTREEARRRIPEGSRSVCVPIRAAADVVGALLVMVPSPRDLTQAELRLLTTIAEMAGNAIHRTRLHEATQVQLRRLTALREIDQAITGSLDLRVTLAILLDRVTSQLDVDAADVLLLSPLTTTLEFAAGRGFRTKAVEESRVRVGAGYAGRAALERRSVYVPDFAEAIEESARPGLWHAEGFQVYGCAPLVSRGQVKGVLEVFRREPLGLDPEWIDFLDTLAGQAAIAIENAQLFDELQRSNFDLALAYDTTLEGWSRALDLRDRETEGHTQRVTETTIRLARALGVAEGELVHIRRGALLHDIGKMGVPDDVLLKPDKLTEEEWVTMRRHPVYAFEMLSPIAYLRPALDIPYCHHERWDGTGYPRGLKANQIPLSARIFAVVDVWDALRSDRPYRPGWRPEEVIAHIREQSGSHFDPLVVTAFLKMSGVEA